MTQTVEIPENRKLTIEVPREVPVGKAHIEFKIIPFDKKEEKTVDLKKSGTTPHTDKLLSLLSNIGEVNIDEIRDERLLKHLK